MGAAHEFSPLAKRRPAMTWLWAMLLTLFGLIPKTEILSPVGSTAPTAAARQPPSITFNNETFAYAYEKKQPPQTLSLIPNFSNPRDVQTLMSENACTSAINGGFYDTDGKPLGYFFTAKRTYGKKIVSPLINGFFWADTSGTAIISTALPDIQYRFALQSGPVLMFNGAAMNLTIQNDERARRMIVAKTADNAILFMTLYLADSAFSGPMLSDLPMILRAVSVKENLDIVDALNLDGGSASAFYGRDTRLSELTPAGSIFCLQ